jgi:hypothetical protein
MTADITGPAGNQNMHKKPPQLNNSMRKKKETLFSPFNRGLKGALKPEGISKSGKVINLYA